MSTPIIMLAGEAGSGKDTVGNYIAKNYGGICLGQADPMKRFCHQVFRFTEEQLWGSTETRNAVVPFSPSDFLSARAAFREHASEWMDSVLPTYQERDEYPLDLLEKWFSNVEHRIVEHGGVAPRFVLQTLGTEWGREIAFDMWNEIAVDACRTLLIGGYTYTRMGGLVEDAAQRGYDYSIITDGRFRNEILNIGMINGVSMNVRRPTKDQVTGGVTGHVSERELGGIPRHFFREILDNVGTLDDLYDLVNHAMATNFGDDRMYAGAGA